MLKTLFCIQYPDSVCLFWRRRKVVKNVDILSIFHFPVKAHAETVITIDRNLSVTFYVVFLGVFSGRFHQN